MLKIILNGGVPPIQDTFHATQFISEHKAINRYSSWVHPYYCRFGEAIYTKTDLTNFDQKMVKIIKSIIRFTECVLRYFF